MRDTPYARELATGILKLGNDEEARAERILVKDLNEEEIRFTWWKNGKMIPRPLDLSETHYLQLLEDAIKKGVFSDDFKARLRAML